MIETSGFTVRKATHDDFVTRDRYRDRASRIAATVAIVAGILSTCTPAREYGPANAAGASGANAISDRACRAPAPDADADGLTDECELELAAAFAPVLVVATGGCDWDESISPARLGGEYYFGVQTVTGGRAVRIAYLPAYYRDCGWRGLKCWLPFVDCSPHIGDSEAIVVEVSRDASTDRWRAVAIFLSAHCFGRTSDGCRWYRGEDLARFRWLDDRPGGAPIVWVAEGRHANYPNRDSCDRGHNSIDSCDHNQIAYRFPVRSHRQNVGSRGWPASEDGCVAGDEAGWNSAMPAADRTECFWDGTTRFRGWQAPEHGHGVTPYARYLEEVAGF